MYKIRFLGGRGRQVKVKSFYMNFLFFENFSYTVLNVETRTYEIFNIPDRSVAGTIIRCRYNILDRYVAPFLRGRLRQVKVKSFQMYDCTPSGCYSKAFLFVCFFGVKRVETTKGHKVRFTSGNVEQF